MEQQTDSAILSRVRRFLTSAGLWFLSGSFFLVAIACRVDYPSMAFIGFGLAALLFMPPFRAFAAKYVSPWPLLQCALLSPWLALLAVGFAFGIAMNEQDAVAVAKGFKSHTEFARAESLGLTSQAQLAAYDSEAGAKAAKEKLQREEQERYREEQEQRDLIAAEAYREEQEQRDLIAAEAKAKEERLAAEEAARREEANCKADLRCWGDKHGIAAAFSCKKPVERLAKYQHEWTDGWLGLKFPWFRWKNKSRGFITYIGDKIKFQNGFGAWQPYTYSCDFDPSTRRVLDVAATPGRL